MRSEGLRLSEFQYGEAEGFHPFFVLFLDTKKKKMSLLEYIPIQPDTSQQTVIGS